MKKLYVWLSMLGVVAALAACGQASDVPSDGGGASSSEAPSQPGLPPSTSAKPPAQASSSQMQSNAYVMADSTSVVLKMPEQVQFGETATATIINNSDYEIVYGAEYAFECLTEGKWVPLRYREGKERVWIAIAYILKPGEEATFGFEILADEFTVPLKAGEYRLIKHISSDNGVEHSNFNITGGFNIK